MYLLTVDGSFDTAHHLPEYDGKCKHVHGHTWNVTAVFEYRSLSQGMAQDFTYLSCQLTLVLEQFDHHDLNEIMVMPTAELIAKRIYDQLKGRKLPVSQVVVNETLKHGVMYYEEEPDGQDGHL